MLNIKSLPPAKNRRRFLVQMAFGTAFTYLTSGVYLSGLAILIGAGDVLVSYISVVANLCGVLILAFSVLLERFRSRKRLTVGLTILTKLFTMFIVIIPALLPAALRLPVFLPAIAAAFALQAQATVALNNWMVVLLGDEKRGRYISLRQTLALIVTVVLSLAGGYLMDAMDGEYIGFVVIFSIAFVMGLLEIAVLLRTPDVPAVPVAAKKAKLRDAVIIPLRDHAFMRYVIYVALFYFMLYVSDSFTMVYLMRYLELPYAAVTAMLMIISLPQVFLLGIWGKISDKRGHDFALKASIWFFAGETLFMLFVTANSYLVFLPIAYGIASIANSGFVVAVFNRRYELMPESNRILYDNFFSAAIGLSFLIAPLAGGAIKYLLEANAVAAAWMSHADVRLLYAVSTVGILALQIIEKCAKKGDKGYKPR